MAKKLDELPLYGRVTEFGVAVTEILDSPGLRKDWNLRRQLADATASIAANIEEGFEQGTDRAFARYVTIAKGSLGEVIGHLKRAQREGRLGAAEVEALVSKALELGRMCGGFIKYLHRCDWRDRGRYTIPDP
ncbi:MAG TPA: four helix bundle protein [Vicinamibacterales bacterium]|nr:four helix bundle protein [Vicinamibacterales bacterium]